MTSYLISNSSGVVTGAGYTPDGTIPADGTACTDAQALAWYGSTIVDGVITAGSPPAPTLAQQAVAAVSAGLAIASASVPAFDATYACDGVTQGKIGSISTYILVNSSFPGGLTEYPWLDMTGTPHIIPTTAFFQKFATAIANYIAALDMIIATNSGTLPATTANIT